MAFLEYTKRTTPTHSARRLGSELIKNVQFELTEIGFYVLRPLFPARIITGMRVLLRSIAGRIYFAHEMGFAITLTDPTHQCVAVDDSNVLR